VSLEAGDEAHLKQVLMLLPRASEQETASDEDETNKAQATANLEIGKSVSAYIKVNQFEVGTDAKPLAENMVTEKPKRK
jgi:hypothetical protein